MVFTFQPPFFSGLSGYVAEMASAFLCAELGIVPTVRHADYIGSWLSVLREDSKAIFRAASHASKAADYLMNFFPPAQSPSQSGEAPILGEGRLAA